MIVIIEEWRIMAKITQKRIDVLDEIGEECGYELHMPPLKNKNNPFFTLDKDDDGKLCERLDDEKFDYVVIEISKKKHVMIRR
jgi:hypothetical protein